jgi:hypothetical protein
VLNLQSFVSALRLRWLWHEWKSPEKAWVETEVPCDDPDRLLFAACTTITLGDGKKMSFWHSSWLHGRRPKDLAPLLFAKSRKKRRSVAMAFQNNNWIRDLEPRNDFTVAHLTEFVDLWNLIRPIELHTQQEDCIKWKLTKHGEYTAASAYKAQFVGSVPEPELATIWKTWAPPECKFFAWLLLQNRVWTSDRLAQRNWDHGPSCPLCRMTMETAMHLLSECRYSRRVWSLVADWVRQPSLRPGEWGQGATPIEWWTNITTRSEVPRDASRSLALLVTWELWKECNARTFDWRESSVPLLLAKIKGEVSLWILAGAKGLAQIVARV